MRGFGCGLGVGVFGVGVGSGACVGRRGAAPAYPRRCVRERRVPREERRAAEQLPAVASVLDLGCA